ncbi:hypothetical protein Tco_0509402 [Tanacetum coccineum]
MSTPYIIIFDSEDDSENSPNIVHILPSPDYTMMSDSRAEPFEHDLEDTSKDEEEEPNEIPHILLECLGFPEEDAIHLMRIKNGNIEKFVVAEAELKQLISKLQEEKQSTGSGAELESKRGFITFSLIQNVHWGSPFEHDLEDSSKDEEEEPLTTHPLPT